MAWYRCVIEGENFPGSLIQSGGLVGFFATRFVEASSSEAAERCALDELRLDPAFALGDQPRPKNARVYFTDVIEVDGPTTPNAGATWFLMDSQDEQDADQ